MNLPADILRREIENNGPISFTRFMEVALYTPEAGYYEGNRAIGRSGDFYTSVSVGGLFGELLAFQFSAWLEPIGAADCQIVEAGAHDGQLAADILAALRAIHPGLFQRIEYWILEPSDVRRKRQQATLGEFASKVRWFHDWEALPNSGINGVIFSNELLDAMPVDRFRWNARKKCFQEVKVTLKGGQFAWLQDDQCCPDDLFKLPSELAAVLPDGFIVEHSPAAIEWWRQAVTALRRGKVVTIDYGFTCEEMFQPERGKGTLRAYARHHVSDDVLAHPGDQDITAHVNFSAIQAVGEQAGLKTVGLMPQGKFLTGILENVWQKAEWQQWDSRRSRQFQTLTHPEHLGRAFRVLIQERVSIQG